MQRLIFCRWLKFAFVYAKIRRVTVCLKKYIFPLRGKYYLHIKREEYTMKNTLNNFGIGFIIGSIFFAIVLIFIYSYLR